VSKKIYQPISRILFPAYTGRLSFICPETYASGSICPPSTFDARRHTMNEQLLKVVYVAFQHVRFTLLIRCRTRTWALTPHFHPFIAKNFFRNHRYVVIFCGTFCSRPGSRPGSSPVHCSMLSRLSSLRINRKAITRLVEGKGRELSAERVKIQ